MLGEILDFGEKALKDFNKGEKTYNGDVKAPMRVSGEHPERVKENQP